MFISKIVYNEDLYIIRHVFEVGFGLTLCGIIQEGKALKTLATAARLDIEDFLQKKVFLEVVSVTHKLRHHINTTDSMEL